MIGWIATGLNIAALLLISAKLRVGWVFGFIAEILWLLRAHEKGAMHDLMFISLVYCGVAVWSFLNWRSPCRSNT